MYPASYSYVIGVMAYDEANSFASFSNWDYKPNANAEYEVVAPGVSVYSPLPLCVLRAALSFLPDLHVKL